MRRFEYLKMRCWMRLGLLCARKGGKNARNSMVAGIDAADMTDMDEQTRKMILEYREKLSRITYA